MKAKVKRITNIIICDNCKKEIKGNYQSLKYSGDLNFDFCNDECQESWKANNDKI